MKYIAILGVAIVAMLGVYAVSHAPAGQLSTVPVEQVLFPEPTNYAVDAAGVLPQDQVDSLNERLKGLDTGETQIGVAIIPSTNPLTIEQYGIQMAEKWKVGDAEYDRGAIIILATEDRNVRLEIGYGLEGDINDAKAGRIIDEYMISHLKENAWYEAIDAGITGIQDSIK